MTNLKHNFFSYICYNPLHVYVSSKILLILRRSNCINTASGVVSLSKWPSGAQVEKRLNSFSTCAPETRLFLKLCTGRSFTESDDTRCCINTIWPREDEQDIARNMYM